MKTKDFIIWMVLVLMGLLSLGCHSPVRESTDRDEVIMHVFHAVRKVEHGQ